MLSINSHMSAAMNFLSSVNKSDFANENLN